MTKRLLVTGLVALAMACALPFVSVPKASAAEPVCTRTDTAVKLTPLGPTTHNIAGWLCAQGELEGQTLQFLTSGLTYDHHYWHWPQEPGQYSYVQAATDAGYAAFIYDRLGIGESDKPDAVSLNLITQAYVAHQLIQGLRAGTVGGHAFDTVISGGHSFGAGIATSEAGLYHDVDGVILSGALHTINPAGIAGISAAFTPVQLDPKFMNAGLPLGYITTTAGARDDSFYYTPNADPAVIALDEQLKQTGTAGELALIALISSPVPSLLIDAPVLVAMGQRDILFCNPLLLLSCANSAAVVARESAYFSPSACLEGHVLTNSGHDTNLHLNAPDWFSAALQWSDARVGTNGTAPTAPC